jgi:hypothetical protein
MGGSIITGERELSLSLRNKISCTMSSPEGGPGAEMTRGDGAEIKVFRLKVTQGLKWLKVSS